MTSPISDRARGILYIVSFIIGAVGVATPQILSAVHASDQAKALSIQILGLLLVISSGLARGNLTLASASTTDAGVVSYPATVSATTASGVETQNAAVVAAAAKLKG